MKALCLLLLLHIGICAYSLEFDENQFFDHFERRTLLGDKLNFLWTVNGADQKIEIGVLAKCTGWIGVGLSESGSMKGADLSILQFDESKSAFDLGDYFSEDYVKPVRESDNYQDWKLTSRVWTNSTHIAYRFERNLLTCDDKDFAFDPKPKYVIYAIGSSGQLGYHGSSTSSRGSKKVMFYLRESHADFEGGSEPADQLEEFRQDDPSSFTMEFAMPNLEVPNLSTSYFCVPLKLNDSALNNNSVQADTEYHITKWVGMPRTELIHHIFIYRCPVHAIQTDFNAPYMCDSKPPQCDPYIAWGLGQGMTELPDDVGIPLGSKDCSSESVLNSKGYSFTDPDCFAYFLVEFHYNNPSRLSGIFDSSAIKVLLTSQLKKYDMGVFMTGPAFPLINIPPGTPHVEYNSECPSSCTSRFPEKGINVFASQLHMHHLGKQIWIQHIRDEVELEEIVRKDYYDFQKQTISYIFPEKIFLPGDRLIVNCVFDSRGRKSVTHGGWTSEDEMCVGFLGYYPRMKTLGYCNIANDDPKWAYCGPSSYVGRINTSMQWDSAYRVPVAYGPGAGNGVTSITYEKLQEGTHLRGSSVCELKAYEDINDPFKGWDEWTPVPLLSIGGFLIFSQLLHLILQRFSEVYANFKELRIQRNMHVYILSLIVLTAGFFLSVIGSSRTGVFEHHHFAVVASHDSDTRKTFLKMSLFGTTLIGMVYVFELVYRISMDAMLYVHHWLTLFLLTVLTFGLHQTLSSFYLKIGTYLSFNATTEQPVFISLLLYRMVPRFEMTRYALIFSSLYTAISKTIFFILAIQEIIRMNGTVPGQEYSWQPEVKWQHFMYVLVLVLTCMLYVVQLRCSLVLFNLSKKSGVSVMLSPADSFSRRSSLLNSILENISLLNYREKLEISRRKSSTGDTLYSNGAGGLDTPEMIEFTEKDGGSVKP